MSDPAKHDWVNDPMFDSAIVQHGFAAYSRDYDVVVDVPASRGDGAGSYIQGRYRYRFTHCVKANLVTRVPPDVWRASWTDELTDYVAWEAAGAPNGFVWGANWAEAYPGASNVEGSELAASWTEKLDHPMHHIRIETNTYVLDLICHDLRIDQLASGDPLTGELSRLPGQGEDDLED
jgi:hypothetical protein